MAHMTNDPPTSDPAALAVELAAVLNEAASPWTDPTRLDDWSRDHLPNGDATDVRWVSMQLRLILLKEIEADADRPDATGPTMWLRRLRVARSAHADDATSPWATAVSAALLRDPARTAVVAALTRWPQRSAGADTAHDRPPGKEAA